MSLAEIRAGLKGALEDVPRIGLVTDYEPWARREEDFRRYFFDPALGYILGWSITRQATTEVDDTHDENTATHLMVIRGYRALADGAATEKDFQDLIETVRARLRLEQRARFGKICLAVGPPQVRTVEARLFADYLVHYVEITQQVQEAIGY